MKRIAFSIITFVLATIIAYQLLDEAAVYYEMHSTGANSRAELADDFGLGVLGMLIVVPGSGIIGIICSWVIWRKFKIKGGAEGEST